MTLQVAGFSGDSFLALGQETTQGTAVNPTLIVDATFQTPVNVDFNPNRQPVQVNVGNINNSVALISRQAQYRASFGIVVVPNTLGTLLSALGFASASGVWTPARPKPCTLYFVDGAADTQVFSGSRLTRMVFRASGQQELQATCEFFVAGVKPAVATSGQNTAIAALTYTGGTALGMPDLGAPTLPGGTTNAELDDFELTLDFGGVEFQGSGFEYPTHNGSEGLTVTGRMTPLHTPAEYAALRDGTVGSGFVFSFQNGVKIVSFTMTKAKYTHGPMGVQRGRFTTDSMEFAAYTNDVTQSQVAIGVAIA